MGLTNKIATKVRTKDQVGTVAITGEWNNHGSLIAASIIRGAACALGGTNVTSSAFRGTDVLGINASRSTRASTIWVEQIGFRDWLLSLGVTKFSYGYVFDWQLKFELVDGPTGRTVNVSTPAQSTHDGTLMNKHQFMESRDLVLTGFRVGHAPSLVAEEAISRSSHQTAAWPLFELNAGVEHRDQSFSTSLGAPAINELMNDLPCRVVERSDVERTVKVGAAGQLGDQMMVISIMEVGESRHVRVRFDIDVSLPTAINLINVKHASFLCSVVLELLSAADATTAVVGTSPSPSAQSG
jgi:hypothetical protein